MKRTLALLLTALCALSPLAGCGGSPSADGEAASAAEVQPLEAAGTEDAAAPERAVIPQHTEVPVYEDGSFYPDGSFPGGLDDDGRGPDEEDFGPMPVEYVDMTADRQYEANIFVSNFAEQFFPDYDGEWDDPGTLSQLVDFAHLWCKINEPSAITYETLDGEVYEVLTQDKARSVVSRYFPLDLDDWDMESLYRSDGYGFARDGKYWFPAADGELRNRFAVAWGLTRMSDGSCVIDFVVYEVDPEVFFSFDNGLPSSYYRLTYFEAEEAPELNRLHDGVAFALPFDYRGRDTYQLLEYKTW